MQVRVTEECIQKANAPFWEQMLSMRLDPICPANSALADATTSSSAQPRCIGPQHLVGSCDLAGVWVGRIEVRLSRGLALHATSAMMMQPVETIQPDDTFDATREITNMLAGSIKSALPRPCTMSVPSAQLESGDFCILPRTHDSVTVFFHHAAGELMIRVWQQMPDSASESTPKL